MANANTVKVEIPQPPIVEGRVLLELTKDEAQVLYDITMYISGHPARTRRGHTDEIKRALRSTGLVSGADSWDIRKGSGIEFT